MSKVAYIRWTEGEGTITASYAGHGDGVISISSTSNEGIDRSQKINVSSGNLSREIKVIQTGLREIFSDFILSDKLTFNVLKK